MKLISTKVYELLIDKNKRTNMFYFFHKPNVKIANAITIQTKSRRISDQKIRLTAANKVVPTAKWR